MTYQDVIDRVVSLIPKTESLKFPGEQGLSRMVLLLNALGRPDSKYKVIHVAGTSGKGSTASFISSVLCAHSFRVGLHVKPHIVDIRERMQVNGDLPATNTVVQASEAVFKAIESIETPQTGKVTYFECVCAIALTVFALEKVDYAVLETGMGGTFDGTNAVASGNKISVITALGLDHVEILGNTIPQIASQKAGIIGANNQVVLVHSTDQADTVVKQRCTVTNSPITVLHKNVDYKVDGSDHTSVTFPRLFPDELPFLLGLDGLFQAENASAAVHAVLKLAKRDGWALSVTAVRDGLAETRLYGRFEELVIGGKTVILDGAHNQQKMASLLEAVQDRFPNSKFAFIVGFKQGKDWEKMLDQIIPVASSISALSFSIEGYDLAIRSVPTEQIGEYLTRKGYLGKVSQGMDGRTIQEVIATAPEKIVVFTGSIYLIAWWYMHLKALLAKV
jgi:dihydrofolate synthase / folylpolyglutamate synthase